MALHHNPRVVTSGLQLLLDGADIKTASSPSEIEGYAFKIDAANPNSYSGSGTTVTSVGTETFTSTLYYGPLYSSEGGGSFLFDGTNDIAISDISNFNVASMSFSVDCWYKFASPPDTGSDDRHGFIGGGGWGGLGDAWRLGGIRYSSNGYREVQFTFFGDGADGPPPADYNEQEWNHYCGTFDISTGKAAVYLNGEQLSIEDSTYISRNNMPLEWGAVIYSANTSNGIRQYYQHGYMGPTRIWKNKSLTSAEVLQQYNSEKSRFFPTTRDHTENHSIDLANVSLGSNSQISFNGTDNYITLPDIDTYSSTAKFTVEGVVKAIGGNWGRIFTNGGSGAGGVTGFINVDLLVYSSSNRPYIALRVGNTYVLSATQVSTKSWSSNDFTMYFAFSVNKENSTGTYLFRFGQNNGLIQEELSGTFTPGTATGFVENRLGGETDDETYAQMDMYTFKMYDRELSMSEMRQNYNAIKGRFNI